MKKTVALGVVVGAFSASGCGGGGGASAPPLAAPAIVTQPVAQSVPMGLSATFSVQATGSSLQYQWYENGAPITGASGSTYVTPATEFADSGEQISVTVTNSRASVQSTSVSLTVTARAPASADLRFQQVDSPATVSGWGNAGTALSTDLLSSSSTSFSPSIGTPLYTGSAGVCSANPAPGDPCAWFFTEVPVAVSSSNPTLAAGYASDTYDNFQPDLANPAWAPVSNSLMPVSSGSVITSLDLEPGSDWFALSWMQTSGEPAFGLEVNTVTPANLQAAITQEGAASRVVTAISYNNGQVTYLSYSWQEDTTTVYEAQVVSASPGEAPSAAASLAAAGYIITATGAADGTGDVYLVGTRVQGDTMARPFITSQSESAQTFMQAGYSIVGVIFDLGAAQDDIYLGER